MVFCDSRFLQQIPEYEECMRVYTRAESAPLALGHEAVNQPLWVYLMMIIPENYTFPMGVWTGDTRVGPGMTKALSLRETPFSGSSTSNKWAFL